MQNDFLTQGKTQNSLPNIDFFKDVASNYICLLKNDLEGENIKPLDFPFCTDRADRFFPAKVERMIKECAEVEGLDRDILTVAVLSAFSTAMGNKRKSVRVQRKNFKDKSTALFCAVVSKSGTSKSPSIDFALNPIKDRELKLRESYGIEKKEYDRAYKFFLKNGGDEPIPPAPFAQTFSTDFTFEKIPLMMANNHNGVLLLVDELRDLLLKIDKNEGGDTFLLNAWNGGQVTRDRVGQSDIFIKNANVGVLGGLQPCYLSKFNENERNKSGLTSRFLFLYKLDLEAVEDKGSTYSGDEYDYYSTLLNTIFDSSELDEVGHLVPHWYKIDGESEELFRYWVNENKALANLLKEPILEGIRSVYLKLDNYLLRFCTILQTIKDFANGNPKNGIIELGTVMNAIHLVEFFRRQAIQVQREFMDTMPKAFKEMKKEHLAFYNSLPDEFSRKQALDIAESFDLCKSKTSIATTVNRVLSKALDSRVLAGNFTKYVKTRGV
ncbi:MAG: DUF3987 domain-containing protein [Bacteroidia bacterium]